jgi:putative DNA primase/helicase
VSAAASTRPSACHQTALNALDLGYSPIPPKEDGSKAPDVSSWKEYQNRLPTRQDVDAWYTRPRTGVGLVTGNLELLEFDKRSDYCAYEDFKAAAADVGLGELVEKIEAGYLERTPSGGFHWFYVCDEARPNTKLAERPAPTGGDPHGREVLIETRGAGGYAIIAPTKGRVHPSGQPYVLLRGGLNTVTYLTHEEREALWDLARTFDEMPAPEPARPAPAGNGRSDGWLVRPGDDFEGKASWQDFLPGWTFLPGDRLRRPGKAAGISATIRGGRLNVYSTSTPFESVLSARRTYSRFEAFALLNHGGNLTAAANALSAQGYGTPAERKKPPATPRDQADDGPLAIRPWPDPPDEAAYHGPAGEITRTIAPHSEADPVAVLVNVLIAFGSAVGRNPHFQVESTRHHANEFACLVGQSALGRKGTAKDRAEAPLAVADPDWYARCRASGLSSGEG